MWKKLFNASIANKQGTLPKTVNPSQYMASAQKKDTERVTRYAEHQYPAVQTVKALTLPPTEDVLHSKEKNWQRTYRPKTEHLYLKPGNLPAKNTSQP